MHRRSWAASAAPDAAMHTQLAPAAASTRRLTAGTAMRPFSESVCSSPRLGGCSMPPAKRACFLAQQLRRVQLRRAAYATSAVAHRSQQTLLRLPGSLQVRRSGEQAYYTLHSVQTRFTPAIVPEKCLNRSPVCA